LDESGSTATGENRAAGSGRQRARARDVGRSSRRRRRDLHGPRRPDPDQLEEAIAICNVTPPKSPALFATIIAVVLGLVPGCALFKNDRPTTARTMVP